LIFSTLFIVEFFGKTVPFNKLGNMSQKRINHSTLVNLFTVPFLFAFALSNAQAQEKRNNYQLSHQQAAIVLDGVMDELAWENATRIDLKYENRPGEGVAARVKTEAYFFEDGENLYVAIKAYDPKPSEIRASLRDRDALWSDDNVGIIVDTFNDERSGYEFFVNPLGAQADMRMDDTDGWHEDASWDAIWGSAGKLTDFGYLVEMSIPFNAIRFPESDGELTWNIAIWRNYARDVRVQLANVALDRNIRCNLCQFDRLTGFNAIESGNNFQLTPTVTLGRNDEKEDVLEDWDEGENESEFGIDLRWGITQDMVLNTTINPDFSQVEADAGQLDVNNTFSLFFPEKRPFFLDGASYFETANFNFVHTRNIATPDYGVKLTGKSDEHSYGVMVANDSNTSFLVPGNQGSDVATLDDDSNVAIVRYKMDVGERNNIGVLMTQRDASDYNNTLLSVDGSYWFSDIDSLTYQLAKSDTDNPLAIQDEFDLKEEQQGTAITLGYSHRTRDYNIRVNYTDVSDDFRADLGFQSRVDYSKLVIGGSQTWYGDKDDVFTEWGYFGDWDKSYDQDGNMLEEEIELHGNLQGPMQLFTNFGLVHRKRFYDDQFFNETQAMMYAQITPIAGLQLRMFNRFGSQIDFANTQLGDVVDIEPSISWDVNENLNIDFSFNYSQLDVDSKRLFTAEQSDIRLSYQFDMRSLVKLVIQYTDIERNPDLYSYDEDEEQRDKRSRYFSTQLVYSYKINPQTLFYLGYSDGGFQDDSLEHLERDQRTIFTKFSYAWQM